MEYYAVLQRLIDHYEKLFKGLELRFDGAEFKKQEEALVWEEQGCKLVLFLLHSLKIPYEITADDIRPQVATTTGKIAEVDFRIKINGNYTYFGVTHFESRPFERDRVIDEPILDLRRRYIGDKLVKTAYHGEARILRRRRQRDYLNKRIVTRIAREGKNVFPCDYIYLLYPKNDPGFGGGLEGIPASFEFGSGYEYRETGITGVMLIGKNVEVHTNGSMKFSKRSVDAEDARF